MCDVSSHGFAGFGLIVSGLLGAYDRAQRYAMVAHKLDERFGNPWLAPKVDLMSGIFIQPWTRGGKLRHPRFLGLREDKRPEEVVREG